MAYDFIEVTEVGAVMVITMDDPPTRNAIGNEMADEINQAIDHLESDANLRALVLTGRDPSFCSGANVKRMDQANRDRTDEPTIPDGTSVRPNVPDYRLIWRSNGRCDSLNPSRIEGAGAH